MTVAHARLPDPKLLQLFDELYRTGSVTLAAANLGQEQPTVSIWLGKLRQRFGDPLFVRTASGMQPTPRADALIEPVRAALARLADILGQPAGFDPATAMRRFRVAMTDASHFTMLPRLLAHVREEAPQVSVEVEPISSATAQAMESGTVDLALGFLPRLGSGFYQQGLFTQDFVCLANAHHPRLRAALTLRQYRLEGHIGVALSGTGHSIVDDAMERHRVERRIVLRLPGFLGLAAIVSTTDLVATVPRQIAESLVRREPLRLHECPVRIPSYAVKQHWHARYHQDPANRWLRAACGELFAPAARAAAARRH